MTHSTTVFVDPDIIYHTHSKIRKRFSGCNKTLDETFQELKNRETSITDIPIITVYFDGEHYYSQNNRRLWLFKKCKEEGLLTEIMVRVIPMGNKKYTAANMARLAKPVLA